jgi:hypothetical protein
LKLFPPKTLISPFLFSVIMYMLHIVS